MNQKKKPTVKMKKVMVRRGDIVFPKPGDPFYIETDPDLVRLIHDVMAGEKPARSMWARVADLRVHDERALTSTRAALAEYPSHVAVMRAVREQFNPEWIVYRDADGALVMFDDYSGYTVAVADKIGRVRVRVLGESAPDIER